MSSGIQDSIWNKRTENITRTDISMVALSLHLSPGWCGPQHDDLGLGLWRWSVSGGRAGSMPGAVVRLITGASSPILGRPRHPARLLRGPSDP